METQLITSSDDFKLQHMTISDADDRSKIFWSVQNWDLTDQSEQRVDLPAEMLGCRALSREIVFFSKHKIEDFTIVQIMSMQGHQIEKLEFKFGFVIPNSTNSWDQVIEADMENMLPAEMLSGNLVVDTYFNSGTTTLA